MRPALRSHLRAQCERAWSRREVRSGAGELSAVRNLEVFGRCITAIVISIRGTDFDRCREVVRFSEGPLWEVRLYFVQHAQAT